VFVYDSLPASGVHWKHRGPDVKSSGGRVAEKPNGRYFRTRKNQYARLVRLERSRADNIRNSNNNIIILTIMTHASEYTRTRVTAVLHCLHDFRLIGRTKRYIPNKLFVQHNPRRWSSRASTGNARCAYSPYLTACSATSLKTRRVCAVCVLSTRVLESASPATVPTNQMRKARLSQRYECEITDAKTI